MIASEEVVSKPAFAVISAGLTERAGSRRSVAGNCGVLKVNAIVLWLWWGKA